MSVDTVKNFLGSLPSYPYPKAKPGYWHPQTATLNFCEEDYYATSYVAEIVNATTNALFLLLAFKGIHHCVKNGHDGIFLTTFVGYLIVGSGSVMFHSTMKYPMQLVDELSMIYTTCLMAYACFGHGLAGLQRLLLANVLVGLAAFITLYYHHIGNPVFHQVSYAILTATVLFRSMWTMENQLRPSRREKNPEYVQRMQKEKVSKKEQARRDRRDLIILKQMWTMITYGMTVFLGGFLIWTLDNEFCSTLRGWRKTVGLPWGLLLEGHGWWHLMTGTGAYFYIVWGIWLRHCINGKQDLYELNWPRTMTSLPAINLVDEKKVQLRRDSSDGFTLRPNGIQGNGHNANGKKSNGLNGNGVTHSNLKKSY